MVGKVTFLLILFTIYFQSTKQETIEANITNFDMEKFKCFREHDKFFFIICDEPEVLKSNERRDWNSIYFETIDVKNCSVPAINTTVPVNPANFNSFVYRANVESSLRSTFFIGWEELKQLWLNDNKITHLEDDVFESLSNIEMIFLKGNKLKNISRNLFRKLKHLEVLDLSSNELMTLENGTFLNQQKMEALHLEHNQLQNLHKEMFNGLTSLTYLDIRFNNLKILRGDTFQHILQLKSLHLSEKVNPIELQEGLFKSNKHLNWLTIKAPVSKLATGFLSHLPELRDVRITGTKLKDVSDGYLLNGSVNIRHFVLKESEINSLPANLFSSQSVMTSLDLSLNGIYNLTDGVFNGLTNLSTLQLQHNNLVVISRTLFSGLKSLRNVDLRNNNLLMIHSNAFANTRLLESVYADNNQLSFNDYRSMSPFRNLNQLRQLTLISNKITAISPDWKELPELYLLCLDRNEISTLKLEDLQFKHNGIRIYLRNNSIAKLQIRETFDDLLRARKNEVHLYLTEKFSLTFKFYKKLQQIRGEIRLTPRYIDIENLNCNLPVSAVTNEERYYWEIKCAVNKSKFVCPQHCECTMKIYSYDLTIDCSYAKLESIPKFTDYKKLRIDNVKLYLDHNNIPELGNLENLPPNLTLLDVSHNKITTMNKVAFNVLQETFKLKPKSIFLGNNHWLCDCSSEANFFAAFIQQYSALVADPIDAKKCELKSGALTELSTEYDRNCSQYLRNIYLILLTCFGLLIGILIAIYFIYQQEIKIWLYWHNLCLWWIDEEMLDIDKKYDAFISYSHHDVDFAVKIVYDLENGNPMFKICVGERDWIAGETILELIKESIQDSRRTIIILTRNYLESVWGQYEFIYAHQQGIVEKRNRVIIIIYGDIGETENMDPTLRSYLNTNTYIKWGESWFWRKLRYSLQHSYKARTL